MVFCFIPSPSKRAWGWEDNFCYWGLPKGDPSWGILGKHKTITSAARWFFVLSPYLQASLTYGYKTKNL
nr:hypothetical protein [uncultured bacterium]